MVMQSDDAGARACIKGGAAGGAEWSRDRGEETTNITGHGDAAARSSRCLTGERANGTGVSRRGSWLPGECPGTRDERPGVQARASGHGGKRAGKRRESAGTTRLGLWGSAAVPGIQLSHGAHVTPVLTAAAYIRKATARTCFATPYLHSVAVLRHPRTQAQEFTTYTWLDCHLPRTAVLVRPTRGKGCRATERSYGGIPRRMPSSFR